MKQNHPPPGGVREGGGWGQGWGEESGDGGKGRFCCCFLPDFSDDMPVVSLGQGPCRGSRGPWLASESQSLGVRIAQPAAAEMER